MKRELPMKNAQIIVIDFDLDQQSITETSAKYSAFFFRLVDHFFRQRRRAHQQYALRAWNAIPSTCFKALRICLERILRNLSPGRWERSRTEMLILYNLSSSCLKNRYDTGMLENIILHQDRMLYLQRCQPAAV